MVNVLSQLTNSLPIESPSLDLPAGEPLVTCRYAILRRKVACPLILRDIINTAGIEVDVNELKGNE